MKSKLYLITLLIMIVAITGCAESKKNVGTTANSPVVIQEESKQTIEVEEKSIEVDKGIFNVELTLPASMFDGENIDEVIAKAKEDGVSEVTKNDDGSLTYKMSKSIHNKIMNELENNLIEYIDGIKTSGDYISIKDVTYNKSFSEFTLEVDQEAFEGGFDRFVALGLGMTAMLYQSFDGVAQNDIKVTIFNKNADTGEIFDTIIYPDVLDDIIG